MYKLISLIIFSMLMTVIIFTPNLSVDLTQSKFNSLTNNTKHLLEQLDGNLKIHIYSKNGELLSAAEELLNKYKKESKFISFELHQNINDPLLIDHILVEYNNHNRRTEINPKTLNEQKVSTLIQQVVKDLNQWIVFLTGHEEADITDDSLMGIKYLYNILNEKGLRSARLNLAKEQSIPSNTSLLVIVNPQFDLMPIEKHLLHEYLTNGGKLLWFTEANAKVSSFLSEEFGIKVSKELILDNSSLKLGSPHPAIKIITTYPKHAITKELDAASILPWSGSLQINRQSNNWQITPFLSLNNLNIGLTLAKKSNHSEQRVAIIADSSFILNKYLPLYANSQLVSNLMQWLQNDAHIYSFSSQADKNLAYHPDKIDSLIFKYGFTLILPLLLISIGLVTERRFKFKGETNEL